MSRVVHFEISAENPERAAAFYTDVFGWNISKWDGPQPYWLCKTGEAGTPGIDGGIMIRSEGFTGTVNSLGVESVDDAIAKVTEHGGSVAMPKMAIPDVGYIAYCKDTEGNIFGLFESLNAQ